MAQLWAGDFHLVALEAATHAALYRNMLINKPCRKQAQQDLYMLECGRGSEMHHVWLLQYCARHGQ